jgi:hypothetical protein
MLVELDYTEIEAFLTRTLSDIKEDNHNIDFLASWIFRGGLECPSWSGPDDSGEGEVDLEFDVAMNWASGLDDTAGTTFARVTLTFNYDSDGVFLDPAVVRQAVLKMIESE